MLQFFKKTGRKRDRDERSSTSASQVKQDDVLAIADDTLLAAEKYWENRSNDLSDVTYLNFSKNILQIVTNKNCLSYFIQFLDTKKALPHIKFWLDADSFRTAAEMCTKKHTNYFEKSKFRTELSEFYKTSDQPKPILSKSVSLNACNSNISHFDCDSISSHSMDNSYVDDERQEDLKSINSDNRSDLNSMTDINELCDMGKPLTDDEKSQLCEQNILKQKTKQKIESLVEQENDIKPDWKSNPSRKCFQSSLASDAIRIFKKYLTTKSHHYIDIPATILSTISLALCSDDQNDIANGSISTLFVDAQNYILEHLEKVYLNQFIESSFYCKYCVDILTGDNLKIRDILYCEAALFYFMEFLEQENQRHFLDFWVAAVNFKKHLEENIETYNNQQAQSDALVLYEKYFSLQATCSLNMSDSVRYCIEESICAEHEPITHCFDLPLNIIERYLEQKYFKPFLTSHLFYKYLSELLHKIDEKQSDNTAKPLTKSKHRKTFSDCTSDKTSQFRNSCFISSQNTLLAMESTKHKVRPSSTSDMQIDARQLYNPDMLWRRNSLAGLSFGRIDALGRYERDFELDAPNEKTNATKGSKIKQVVRKLVNLPEDKVQEEIAWQVAEMIVKDITNVTLNNSGNRETM